MKKKINNKQAAERFRAITTIALNQKIKHKVGRAFHLLRPTTLIAYRGMTQRISLVRIQKYAKTIIEVRYFEKCWIALCLTNKFLDTYSETFACFKGGDSIKNLKNIFKAYVHRIEETQFVSIFPQSKLKKKVIKELRIKEVQRIEKMVPEMISVRQKPSKFYQKLYKAITSFVLPLACEGIFIFFQASLTYQLTCLLSSISH